MRLCANTGFLYPGLPFPARIAAAASDGFDAVEFHDEAQGRGLDEVLRAVEAAGVPVAGLNSFMGPGKGRAGLAGEEAAALEDFRAALRVADAVDARAIHVLCGITADPRAPEILAGNLRRFAELTDRLLLIEPISARAIPGYGLRDIEHAARVLDRVGADNVALLFDVFHIAAEGHDVAAAFARHADRIGHVQIASYPRRDMPGAEVAALLPEFAKAGLSLLGCEFHPPEKGLRATDLRKALGLPR